MAKKKTRKLTPEERAAREAYSKDLDRRLIEMIERYRELNARRRAEGQVEQTKRARCGSRTRSAASSSWPRLLTTPLRERTINRTVICTVPPCLASSPQKIYALVSVGSSTRFATPTRCSTSRSAAG